MILPPHSSLGAVFGLIPSSFMLISSLLPSLGVHIDDFTEASIQNTAAGMIIGAVGLEFFPVIKDCTEGGNLLGVAIGFFVSLAVLLGVEWVVVHLSNNPSPAESEKMESLPATEATPLVVKAAAKDGWEPEGIGFASKALNSDAHQSNLKARLHEISEYVKTITSNCQEFLKEGEPSSIAESEQTFERIDQALHMLNYKIDHTGRLLQGSEFEVRTKMQPYSSGFRQSRRPKFDDRQRVKDICNNLDSTSRHILEHAEYNVSPLELMELYGHLQEMQREVDLLHEHVESASRKWRRSQPFPDTASGDYISTGLVIPVCIDSMVDGIVLGIATSSSINAGAVMAIVNSMEMSFLGMAYSPRVFRCTGSSLFARYLFVVSPPLILAFYSAMGFFLGSHASNTTDQPNMFAAILNTFSAVALLLLSCNSLLIEARNTHDRLTYPEWWEPITLVFVGVFFVIVSDYVTSKM